VSFILFSSMLGGIQCPLVYKWLSQACDGDGACIDMLAFRGLGFSGSCYCWALC